jgi:ribosomal protein S18 acetylase RimI-like enzyme/ribosomal protein S27AE
MNIRAAESDDRPAIRSVAGRSFQTSYALSPDEIEMLVETVFSDDALAERLAVTHDALFVAEDGGSVVGFAEVVIGDGGTLQWLHVDPDARGAGVGTALVERVRSALFERDLAFSARVLEEASEGKEFLERFGLHRSGSERVTFAGDDFVEQVYTPLGTDHPASEPGVEVPASVHVEGAERPVDRSEPLPGTDAPFFPVYADEAREERFGFFCSNCASTNVAADGLDRLECENCGNRHLADTWDAAYL